MLERRLLRCRDVLLSWKKPTVSREDERPKFDIQHRPLSYWRILREKEKERERETPGTVVVDFQYRSRPIHHHLRNTV